LEIEEKGNLCTALGFSSTATDAEIKPAFQKLVSVIPRFGQAGEILMMWSGAGKQFSRR